MAKHGDCVFCGTREARPPVEDVVVARFLAGGSLWDVGKAYRRSWREVEGMVREALRRERREDA